MADDPGNYDHLMTFLFAATRRCDEFIKRCAWNGHAVDCGLLFQLVPTDAGFCCAFNLEPDQLPPYIPLTRKNDQFHKANFRHRCDRRSRNLSSTRYLLQWLGKCILVSVQ